MTFFSNKHIIITNILGNTKICILLLLLFENKQCLNNIFTMTIYEQEMFTKFERPEENPLIEYYHCVKL